MSAKQQKRLRRAAKNFKALQELSGEALDELGDDAELMYVWFTTALGVLDKDKEFPLDELLPSKLLLTGRLDSLF